MLGALDRSARIIHLPRSQSGKTDTTHVTQTLQERFLIAHELGQDVLPWLQDALYLDNDVKLLPHVRTLFEREANYFAAALLLQSPVHGRALSRALTTGGLAALWRLANARGVSRHYLARSGAILWSGHGAGT
jgi:Zn-dependent peptidase ImmA (M78 family)